MGASAYHPYQPLRRPGGSPHFVPAYRVLIHRKYAAAWDHMVDTCGEQAAQQCWDHLATNPGGPPPINSSTPLKGKAFAAQPPFSRVMHYRAGSAARIDYRFADHYQTTPPGSDPHRVTVILFVGRSSATT